MTSQGRTPWGFTRSRPCPVCHGWIEELGSTCAHDKYVCPKCGRKQCWMHWPYPMSTRDEALHFLKSAELQKGKRCFVREVMNLRGGAKWKIFTSEEDYESFARTGKHAR